jgi:hypothetical protein
MPVTQSDVELMEAAQRYYDEELKSRLEPEHNYKYIAIDPNHRRFAIHERAREAFDMLREQGSEPPMALLRVGCEATYDMYRIG